MNWMDPEGSSLAPPPRVDPLVLGEVGAADKGLATLLALVGLLTGVDLLVSTEL